MKEILKKSWNYTLFENNEFYFLCVVCGGVAMFEINIKLTQDEKTEYEKSGESFIDNLARDIQNYPSKYAERNTKLPTDNESLS